MAIRIGINGFGRIGRNVLRASLGKPLVDYYANWASSGSAGAPKHIKVDGMGDMGTIKDAILTSLK